MKSVWHSWFWNLVTMVGLLVMALAAVASTVSQLSLPADSAGRVPVAIGFGLVAGVFAVGAVRALLLGVWARPSGIVMRGLTSTTTIPWGEVQEIRVSSLTSGAGAMVGATTPVVVRIRPGKEPEVVELNAVGGYGMFRSGPTLEERAAMGLNEHLARWRKEHSAST